MRWYCGRGHNRDRLRGHNWVRIRGYNRGTSLSKVSLERYLFHLQFVSSKGSNPKRFPKNKPFRKFENSFVTKNSGKNRHTTEKAMGLGMNQGHISFQMIYRPFLLWSFLQRTTRRQEPWLVSFTIVSCSTEPLYLAGFWGREDERKTLCIHFHFELWRRP